MPADNKNNPRIDEIIIIEDWQNDFLDCLKAGMSILTGNFSGSALSQSYFLWSDSK